jgi:hypothetical protein
MKYIKKTQNCPKFEQGVINYVGRPHKKKEQKNKKIISSPSARTWHSGKRLFPEC